MVHIILHGGPFYGNGNCLVVVLVDTSKLLVNSPQWCTGTFKPGGSGGKEVVMVMDQMFPHAGSGWWYAGGRC